MKRKSYFLGEELIRRGAVTLKQIDQALSLQEESHEALGAILVRLGFLTEVKLLEVLSDQLNMPFVDPLSVSVDKTILARVPAKVAQHYHVFPIRKEGDGVLLASSDPLQADFIEELKAILPVTIYFALAERKKIDLAIQRYYGIGASVLEDLVKDDIKRGKPQVTQNVQMVEDANVSTTAEGTVRDLVNQLLMDAQKKRASDIHIEPFPDRLSIRYRVDGVMIEANVSETVRQFHANIISRIKIMASLDVSERRLPQDGRIKIKLAADELDLRVSLLPTTFGESLVIRLLSPTRLIGIDQVGFSQAQVSLVQKAITKHAGIFLLTGPTGSGKTTTLYACLKELNEAGKKIITIEDPIEYQISGVVQMQVHPKIGLTFASGLRHMLRHDPDVMMVGEIRDLETAEISIRSALTGHLVFSTLHTNDAPGAVARLIDMGIEPYLVASSLECVIAQRLVRQICKHCKTKDTQQYPALMSNLNMKDLNAHKGAGCEHCSGTGYFGRIAIHEVLLISDVIRDCISRNLTLTELRQEVVKQGMLRLVEDGIDKVRNGITTVSEVIQFA